MIANRSGQAAAPIIRIAVPVDLAAAFTGRRRSRRSRLLRTTYRTNWKIGGGAITTRRKWSKSRHPIPRCFVKTIITGSSTIRRRRHLAAWVQRPFKEWIGSRRPRHRSRTFKPTRCTSLWPKPMFSNRLFSRSTLILTSIGKEPTSSTPSHKSATCIAN